MQDFIRHVQKVMAGLEQRVMNAFARGEINLVDDSPQMQEVQASFLADETHDGLERIQNYGFTSVPLPGAECVAIFMGGSRDHGVVIAADDRRYRLIDLEPGDVGIYSSGGNSVILRADKSVDIFSPETIRMHGKKIEIHADQELKLDAGGNGQHWHATTRDDYTTGSTVTGHALHPTEIP